MKNIFLKFVFVITVITFVVALQPAICQASKKGIPTIADDGITPENLDARYIAWLGEPVSVKSKIANKKYGEQIQFMHDLRDTLEKNYADNPETPNYNKIALHQECNTLAVGLIHQIAVLKKKYHSFFMPVVHNMMISVGMRKRGACKHWAEDLLEYMRPIDRKFFYLNWAEAHPGKIGEHNVAVLIPKGSPFEKGIFIDPWRTSGKPFWLSVTKDKHYHWKRWDGWEGL